jgi:hypothetical protein
MDSLDRKRLEIDALEAPNVDGPSIERLDAFLQLMRRGITGPAKGENAAHATDAHMVDLGVHFEADATAMTRPCARGHGASRPCVQLPTISDVAVSVN